MESFDWKSFAQQHQDKLHLDAQFWDFWRFFFWGTEQERHAWKAADSNFANHMKQLQELISLAAKKYE